MHLEGSFETPADEFAVLDMGFCPIHRIPVKP